MTLKIQEFDVNFFVCIASKWFQSSCHKSSEGLKINTFIVLGCDSSTEKRIQKLSNISKRLEVSRRNLIISWMSAQIEKSYLLKMISNAWRIIALRMAWCWLILFIRKRYRVATFAHSNIVLNSHLAFLHTKASIKTHHNVQLTQKTVYLIIQIKCLIFMKLIMVASKFHIKSMWFS